MKIKAFWALTFFLLTLSITLTAPMAYADGDAVRQGKLTSQIDYWFVGHYRQFDDEGRLLVWEGTIEGDFTGEMKWWFVMPSPVFDCCAYMGGRVAFYSARWEIWDGEELLLAGESAGKTVFPVGADGMWDGHGVVTEARKGPKHSKKSKGLKHLKGRKIYETGPVIVGDAPPLTYRGTGMFLIY
jgi:hypothetical protein